MFAQDQEFAAGSVCMIVDDCYSDLYKDVYGCRPRGWNVWASVEAFDEDYSYLVAQLASNEAQRVEDETRRYNDWIRGVHALAVQLNARVGDVIRWQFDATGDDVNSKYDREGFCWSHGFSYEMGELIRKTQGA